MDSNIDSNIDPNIESQSGLFTKFSINNDFQSGEQVHDDFINQQYIEDNNSNNSNAAATAAAVAAENLSNIINFNHLQSLEGDRSNTSSPPPSSSNVQSRSQGITTSSNNVSHSQKSLQQRESSNTSQDALNFISDTFSSLDQDNNNNNNHNHNNNGHGGITTVLKVDDGDKQPKQRVIHDTDSQVSIVVVNPASTEGTRRLGRPRKNIARQNNHSPANDSSQNFNESILSKFRFDSLPVAGPGSRGGRKKKPALVTKPGRQSTLFEKNGLKQMKIVIEKPDDKVDGTDGKSDQETTEPTSKATPEEKEEKVDEDDEVIVGEEVKKETPKSQPRIILEDYHSLKAKGRSTARDSHSDVFAKLGLVQQKKKNVQPKKRKDIPGSIVGAYYDAYEPDSVDKIVSQKDEDLNLVALGFEMTPAPYAKDIMTILEFTNKFKSVLGDLESLGPQDFEEGLKLRPSTPYPLENAKQKTAEKLYDYETNLGDEVSPLMNSLLYRLLTLVLNRKRPIDKNLLKRGLEELKTQVLLWGLPIEWRDDSSIFQNNEISNNQDEVPVDPETPEILDSSRIEYGTTKPLPHTPLDNEDFEINGLNSLEPKDRLIFLRSLVQWCLTNSDIIKQEVSEYLSKQESSGEKETYYISRFVKDGSKGIEASSKEKPFAKKKQQTASKEGTPDVRESSNELNADPKANPLDHHMSFRLLTFYAGDAGINGRFFLCRSASSKTGGLATYKDISTLLTDSKSIDDLLTEEQPSRFKLYVQDVTTMLSDVYRSEGSIDGIVEESLDPWYEIAGDTVELKKFVDHLSGKLSSIRSKQLSNLYNYLNSLLPILEKFETIRKEYRITRSSRKREQVTDYRENDKRLKQMIDESEDNEFLNHSESGDDSDDEEAGYDVVDADDDDDDDYRE